MRKVFQFGFILLILLLSNCSSKKPLSESESNKQRILFEFKGIRPSFFKNLEKSIRKDFSKENIEIGFVYNFVIPPMDNRDYQNLPNYYYDKGFDFNWVIEFETMINKRYNPRERSVKWVFLFDLSLFHATKKIIDSSKSTIDIYDSSSNHSRILSKRLLKKYKMLLSKNKI